MGVTEGDRFALPLNGAGRFIDVYWPNPLQAFVSNGAIGAQNAVDRLGTVVGSNLSTSFGGNTSVPSFSRNAGGMGKDVVWLLVNPTAAGVGSGIYLPFATGHPALSKGQGGTLESPSEMRCQRWIITQTYNSSGAFFTGDMGFELSCDNAGARGIYTAACPGIGFKQTSNFVVSLAVRSSQGGLLTEFPISPAGFDPTLMHTYELRIIGATFSQDAVLKAYIDGSLRKQISWGAGSILPLTLGSGPLIGFMPIIITNTGVGFFVESFRYIAAPTEAATL